MNKSPLEVPRPKPLGACDPTGFGLGTSKGDTFNIIPPRLLHIMFQSYGLTKMVIFSKIKCVLVKYKKGDTS